MPSVTQPGINSLEVGGYYNVTKQNQNPMSPAVIECLLTPQHLNVNNKKARIVFRIPDNLQYGFGPWRLLCPKS